MDQIRVKKDQRLFFLLFAWFLSPKEVKGLARLPSNETREPWELYVPHEYLGILRLDEVGTKPQVDDDQYVVSPHHVLSIS